MKVYVMYDAFDGYDCDILGIYTKEAMENKKKSLLDIHVKKNLNNYLEKIKRCKNKIEEYKVKYELLSNSINELDKKEKNISDESVKEIMESEKNNILKQLEKINKKIKNKEKDLLYLNDLIDENKRNKRLDYFFKNNFHYYFREHEIIESNNNIVEQQ